MVLSVPSLVGAVEVPFEPSATVVQRVADLHSLTFDGALQRLRTEEIATNLYWSIRLDPPAGFAGAWFDPVESRLVVASNSPEHRTRIERQGGRFVLVQWSGEEIDTVAHHVRSLQATHPSGAAIREFYTDFQRNKLVVGVRPAHVEEVRELLSNYSELIVVEPNTQSPGFSSGPVWGAMGTRNYTWQQQYSGKFPCSVAVAINGGFLTAGHCNIAGHIINSDANLLLGTVMGSSFSAFSGGPQDSAWVETVTGWTPGPAIIGYSSGIIDVPAKWSGLAESPVGATVCRYGETSGGPHCGVVEVKNLDIIFGGYFLSGITRLLGSCSNAGDSGGPHLAAGTNQVQGLNIGGDPTGTCPNPATHVLVQPLATAVGLWSGKHMLTTHGAAAPTVSFFLCPDMANSGSGQYQCTFSEYDSQGATTVAWSSSTGHSGSGPTLFGACTPGFLVDVYLTITNPYGTYVNSKTFTCPTTILP
jgi:hypothetical protein